MPATPTLGTQRKSSRLRSLLYLCLAVVLFMFLVGFVELYPQSGDMTLYNSNPVRPPKFIDTTIDPTFLEAAYKAWGNRTLEYADSSSKLTPPPATARVAGRTHYSMGQVRPFIGNIDDIDVFSDMLQARAFKKELIMTMSDVGHLDFTFNLVMQLERQGFEHHVVLTLDRSECLIMQRYHARGGCMWSDFLKDEPPPVLWHNIRRLWLTRWLVFSRVIQFGYNILMLDTDNLFTNDFYAIVKAPELASYNLFTAYEPNMPGINCGLIYAQGASPEGPIAWMGGEIAERSLRWVEGVEQLMAAHPDWGGLDYVDNRVMYEQDIYNDAACSAMAGFLTYRNSLSPNPLNAPQQAAAWDALHAPYCQNWATATLTIPPEWAPISGYSAETVLFTHLRLPVHNKTWIEQTGQEPYPFPLKLVYLRPLLRWLYAFPGNMYPDPYQPSDVRRARAIVERMVRAPEWLLSRWPEVGQRGGWMFQPPRAVLGHAISAWGTQGEGKYGPFKVYGWWYYEVDALLRGPEIFGVSTPTQMVPPLVAAAPGANLFFHSMAEYNEYVNNLFRLAAMSGRTPVWPLIDCRSPHPVVKKVDLWTFNATQPTPVSDSRVVLFGTTEDLHCLLLRPLVPACVKVALPHYDLDQALAMVPTTGEARQGNTLLHHQLRPLPPVNYPDLYQGEDMPLAAFDGLQAVQGQFEDFFELPADDMQRELDKMAGEPIVYLGHKVRLLGYGDERFAALHDRFVTRCVHDKEHYPTLWQNRFIKGELGSSYQYPT